MLKTYIRRSRPLIVSALLGACCLAALPRVAQAQAIVLSVNGLPITSYDIDQRMKLLRLLRKPASKQAAIDDLITDKVKLGEISKFTITMSDSDVAAQAAQDALAAKVQPAQFAQQLQNGGIDEQNWREHFKAEAEWNMYVKAMNKTLDVSSGQVSAEMAKQGQSAALTEYLVRQVVIVTPNGSALDQKMREAEQLRTRFDSCQRGVAMAESAPDVVVQALVTRTSSSVTDEIRAAMDKTPVGRLTPPVRSADGVQMIAVCGKKVVRDSTEAGAPLRNKLVDQRLERASAALYAPVRARAVIVHP